MEEGIISEARPKVGKVAPDDKDSDSGGYNRSDGKPVYVDVDKVMAERNELTLGLLPNRSEDDEINNNNEKRDMGD